MNDLEALRDRIPSYAGYADETSRHLADQQIRAWAGERLAKLDVRLALSKSDLAAKYERMLFACEFGDPALLLTLEKREFDEAELSEVYRIDRAIVEAALNLESAELPAVSEILDQLATLFKDRVAVISCEPEAQRA
jgi:hypothetical protein